MARRRRPDFRILLAAILALAGAAGCGGSGSRPAATHGESSSPATKTQSCPGQPADARQLTLTTNESAKVAAIELGTGTKGVLLIPESGRRGKCGWMPYATELAAKGLRVLATDMPDFNEGGVHAIDAGVNELRSNGAHTVVLVGASAGATTALAAEESAVADTAPGVTAVVALSADELGDLPTHAPIIHVPTLMAVAEGDPYVSTADERHLFDALAAPPQIKKLDIRPPGSGHGWDLLADPGFKAEVTDFIAAQLATGFTVWGTGPRTVVLSNQSDEDQDSWQTYADHLVAEGYRVAMWDYGTSDAVSGLGDVVKMLREQQTGPVFLIGASKGGKTSLVAAADLKPPVTGVVTLSAEAVLSPNIDVSTYVKRLTCPVLLLTATEDGYGSADAAKTFEADLPNLAHTLAYPGADHGTALLSGPTGSKVIADIDAFLQAH